MKYSIKKNEIIRICKRTNERDDSIDKLRSHHTYIYDGKKMSDCMTKHITVS